jgi:hypothetical protein
MPSCAKRLKPQHQRVPSVRVAQVWLSPALTLAQVVASPTRTGAVRPVVVPSPSWPRKLLPQHHSVPSVRTAQV